MSRLAYNESTGTFTEVTSNKSESKTESQTYLASFDVHDASGKRITSVVDNEVSGRSAVLAGNDVRYWAKRLGLSVPVSSLVVRLKSAPAPVVEPKKRVRKPRVIKAADLAAALAPVTDSEAAAN